MRLDPAVLEWLRSKGNGHLTRINDILTNLMEAERGTGSDRLEFLRNRPGRGGRVD
jgi:BrnA antitoxin of type II toxin-antitoxin system